MTLAMRHADYGQRWGEGAARYFYIESDFLDENLGMRLMPVPDGFFCPISAAIMADPVSTVDGCAYEREYIERWFRERRQQRQTITSPATGLELLSTTLMPLVALQRAIEAYLAHRPELKQNLQAGRSYEEAAQALQADLLEKQAMHASVHDEMRRLREANRALRRALERSEERHAKVLDELLQLKAAASLTNPGAADTGGKEQPHSPVRSSDQEVLVDMQPVATSDPGATAPDARAVESGSISSPAREVAICEDTSHGVLASAPEGYTANAPAVATELLVATTSTSAVRGTAIIVGSDQLLESSAKAAKGAAEETAEELERSSAAISMDVAMVTLPAISAETRIVAGRDPASVALAQLPNLSKRKDDQVTGSQSDVVRAPASVPRAETSSHPKTNENVTAASGGACSAAPAKAARAEERETNAEDALRQSSERVHSSVRSPSNAGVVTRPSCLPLPLSSDEEKTSCGSSESGNTNRRRSADRSASAIWSWLVLLITVGIVTVILQLPRVNPGFGRMKQIQDIFWIPAPWSSFVGRHTAATIRDHAVTSDIRNFELPVAASVVASPADAARLELTTSQEIEETSSDVASDIDVPGNNAWLIQEHVEKLRSGSLDEKVHSAAALEALALQGPAEQAAIGRAGAVRALVELVRSESRREVRGTGAAALGAVVAGSSENQLIAWRAGAISTIVKLLKASVAPKIAAVTLRNLATNNANNQAAIVRAGAIPPLVDLMIDGSLEVRLEAAAALEELAGERSATNLYDKQVAFVQSGAIPPLVRLLSDKAGGVRRAAAGMLRMLATHNADNQVAIAQAGAILPLAVLLTDAEAEVRREAAAALGRLSFFEAEANFGNQAGIGQSGAIPCLVALLQDPSHDVHATAAGTLRDLATSNAENQIRMLNAGVIQPLIALLESDDNAVQLAAMRLVRSLAGSSAQNQLAMARAGVLKRLLQLMKVPQTRGEAGRALASLARNSLENRATIKQAGVNLDPHVADSP